MFIDIEKIKIYRNYLNKQNHEGIEQKKVLTTFLHELAYKKNVILDAPVIVGLIVTDKCNLNCPHCFSNNCGSLDATTDEIKRVIDQIVDVGVISLYLTGGEPFMRTDLEEIIAYIKKKRLFLTIHTNALLLNRERVKKISQLLNKEEDVIQISIDGSTLDISNKMRTLNSKQFDRFKRNCELLSEFSVPTKINVTVTNHNVQDLVNIYQYAAKIKAKQIAFSTLFEIDTNDGDTYLPSSKELMYSFCDVLEEAKKMKNPVQIIQDPIAVPCGVSELQQIFNENKEETPWYFCPAGTLAIEIDTNGNIFPCPFLRSENFNAGNINEQSLSLIWKSGKRWESFRDRYLRGYEGCSGCSFSDSCRGACAAQAYHKGMTMYDPDPRCDVIINR
ncbi:hypothetical protein BKK42_04280 [Bacillus cereus]|nr:hypothetical protein BKK43_12285 [Bacillus cereus]ONG86971.1 hypothetical protein BKK42_04280 [Bacillus cereus]